MLCVLIILLALIYACSGSYDNTNSKLRIVQNEGCGILPAGLERSFVRLGSKYYHISNQKLSWFAAGNKCARMNAHLATFETPQQYQAVAEFLHKNSLNGRYWTDINAMANDNTYTYRSNGGAIKFHTTPNSVPTHQADCVAIDESYAMIENNCGDLIAFICEAQISSITVW